MIVHALVLADICSTAEMVVRVPQVANFSATHGKGMIGIPKQESTYITLTIADNGSGE